jgi:HAAS domain-containing protein
VIEQYLVELRRRLPFYCRRRVLEEVEEHLRLSARAVGEEQAVARFGPVDEVARSFCARARALYTALVLAAAVTFPVLAYPIPENQLPPAPWPSADQMPAELAWKLDAIVWLFAAAAAAGAVALSGYVWRRRMFAPAALASLVSLVGVGSLGTILYAQWREHVPSTPPGLLVLGPLQIALAVVGLTLLARASRSEPLAQHPEDAADDLAL